MWLSVVLFTFGTIFVAAGDIWINGDGYYGNIDKKSIYPGVSIDFDHSLEGKYLKVNEGK